MDRHCPLSASFAYNPPKRHSHGISELPEVRQSWPYWNPWSRSIELNQTHREPAYVTVRLACRRAYNRCSDK